jgi:hypothetical protein
VLSATKASTDWMESFLKREYRDNLDLSEAIRLAADAWSAGQMANTGGSATELPGRDHISGNRQQQLATAGIEAAILERGARTNIRYRTLSDDEARALIGP